MRKCQMTMDVNYTGAGRFESVKCDRPAKFKSPKPEMRVEYVCGIHAGSLNKMFERTGQKVRCLPLKEEQ